MNLRPNRSSEEVEINLTPLIDVVFLLLIFFMVSTTFTRESEVSVDLPEASGEALEVKPQVVEISIDAQGHYFINRQGVINTQLSTLKRAIRKAAAGSSEPQLIISADRKTPHEFVVRAMDAARQLNFTHLTFATRRPEKE
ncbi:MAG TPA: biopolymer transporter ExbD [Gammaproteobacteria bacterium]|nr:biopolymer transporter ExbD [Gammaproteobacteria bacterium]